MQRSETHIKCVKGKAYPPFVTAAAFLFVYSRIVFSLSFSAFPGLFYAPGLATLLLC